MGLHVLIVVLSALASIIAFPVAGGFRISLGIVVLFACIHAFQIKRPIRLALVTGIVVCLTRMFLESFSTPMTATLATNYFLEVFFYLGYGIIYYFAITKNESAKYPLPLVVALTIADGGGNFLEYYLRHMAADEAWLQTSLVTILFAAFARSVLIVLLSWLLSNFITPKLAKEES